MTSNFYILSRKILILFLIEFNRVLHFLLTKSYSALYLLKSPSNNVYNSYNLSQVDVIPKGMYECIPKDTCVFGPSDPISLG